MCCKRSHGLVMETFHVHVWVPLNLYRKAKARSGRGWFQDHLGMDAMLMGRGILTSCARQVQCYVSNSRINMIALDLSVQMFLKGKDVRSLPSKVVLSYTLSSLKRSKKYQCHLSRYIVDNDGHPPRSCSSSKTFEN